MRIVAGNELIDTIEQLCIRACYALPRDVEAALQCARREEPWPLAQHVLDQLMDNARIAQQGEVPICQDTGMAVVVLRIGQQVQIAGGALRELVDEGVRRGYRNGYLRKSVVQDPLRRVNTLDNTPALLHVELVPGDAVEVTVAPKGFGSENMSRLAMLKPADGEAGVRQFVIETVRLAGSNPCPPIVVGVGIGGSFDTVAWHAKHALLREIGTVHPDPFYAQMEAELLQQINALGIGPQGLGGRTTALAVHIETAPTHIAGLPCAVNLNCHVTRHASAII